MANDFSEWLRTEIEHAQAIRDDYSAHSFSGRRPSMEAIKYINGRLTALREVKLAYERSAGQEP